MTSPSQSTTSLSSLPTTSSQMTRQPPSSSPSKTPSISSAFKSSSYTSLTQALKSHLKSSWEKSNRIHRIHSSGCIQPPTMRGGVGNIGLVLDYKRQELEAEEEMWRKRSRSSESEGSSQGDDKALEMRMVPARREAEAPSEAVIEVARNAVLERGQS